MLFTFGLEEILHLLHSLISKKPKINHQLLVLLNVMTTHLKKWLEIKLYLLNIKLIEILRNQDILFQLIMKMDLQMFQRDKHLVLNKNLIRLNGTGFILLTAKH